MRMFENAPKQLKGDEEWNSEGREFEMILLSPGSLEIDGAMETLDDLEGAQEEKDRLKKGEKIAVTMDSRPAYGNAAARQLLFLVSDRNTHGGRVSSHNGPAVLYEIPEAETVAAIEARAAEDGEGSKKGSKKGSKAQSGGGERKLIAVLSRPELILMASGEGLVITLNTLLPQ